MARTQAVRVWVRRLCAAVASDAARDSRVTLGSRLSQPMAGGTAADDIEDDDGGGGEDDWTADQLQPPCHLAGQWKDGCFYGGDGSVAYYTETCADDPYR